MLNIVKFTSAHFLPVVWLYFGIGLCNVDFGPQIGQASVADNAHRRFQRDITITETVPSGVNIPVSPSTGYQWTGRATVITVTLPDSYTSYTAEAEGHPCPPSYVYPWWWNCIPAQPPGVPAPAASTTTAGETVISSTTIVVRTATTEVTGTGSSTSRITKKTRPPPSSSASAAGSGSDTDTITATSIASSNTESNTASATSSIILSNGAAGAHHDLLSSSHLFTLSFFVAAVVLGIVAI